MLRRKHQVAMATCVMMTLTSCFTSQGELNKKTMAKKDVEMLKPEKPGALFVNVKDFGAVGDGKIDDQKAIQKAIDAACIDGNNPAKNAPRRVVFPPGIYRLTKSVKLNPAHWNVVLEGTGGATGGVNSSYHGVRRANTVLRWDGAKNGVLMDAYGVLGMCVKDLLFDGQGKCKVLLRMNSLDKDNKDKTLLKKFGSRASALWFLERVSFENADTGFECGGDSWTCASDMTMIDTNFSKCHIGFATLMDQNLNYNFIRPGIGECDIGLYFKCGGSVSTTMLSGHSCGYAIKIEKGGINAGVFSFDETRVEARIYKGRRTRILYAKGESNVKFTSLVTTCMGLSKPTNKISVEFGKEPDMKSALFTIRDGAMVKVESSMISGPIADMKGKCWLEMDNCRFRFLADPRKDIFTDKNAGFEIRNSFLTEDHMEQNKYIIDKQLFIKNLWHAPNMKIISKGETK